MSRRVDIRTDIRTLASCACMAKERRCSSRVGPESVQLRAVERGMCLYVYVGGLSKSERLWAGEGCHVM